MKQSEIWEYESQDRKEQLAEYFKDAFNLDESDGEREITKKIKDKFEGISLQNIGELDTTSIDMFYYFKGEKNKSNLIKGLSSIITEKQQKQRKQEYYGQKRFKRGDIEQ